MIVVGYDGFLIKNGVDPTAIDDNKGPFGGSSVGRDGVRTLNDFTAPDHSSWLMAITYDSGL